MDNTNIVTDSAVVRTREVQDLTVGTNLAQEEIEEDAVDEGTAEDSSEGTAQEVVSSSDAEQAQDSALLLGGTVVFVGAVVALLVLRKLVS